MSTIISSGRITQELANKYFRSSLGYQLDELFSAPDGQMFIRYEEAAQHCDDNDLSKLEIDTWVPDFDQLITEPLDKIRLTDRQRFHALELAIPLLYELRPDFQEEHTTGWDMMRILEVMRNEVRP